MLETIVDVLRHRALTQPEDPVYAGLVPVPVIPPRPNQPADTVNAVIRGCGARFILTDSRIHKALETQGLSRELRRIASDEPVAESLAVQAEEWWVGFPCFTTWVSSGT